MNLKPIAIGGAVLLIVAGTIWFLSSPGEQRPTPQPVQRKADQGPTFQEPAMPEPAPAPAPPPPKEMRPASIDLSSTELAFGEIRTGTVRELSVQLHNTGDEATAIPVRINLTQGDRGAFNAKGSCLNLAKLEGGAVCSIDLVFQPAKDGTAEGSLVIDTDPVRIISIKAASTTPAAPPAARGPIDDPARDMMLARSAAAQTQPINLHGKTGPDLTRRTTEDHWDYLGIQEKYASLPRDMSNVILGSTRIPGVIDNVSVTEIGNCNITAHVGADVHGDSQPISEPPLIPYYSLIEGHCASAGNAQDRLGVIWTRILTPKDKDGRRRAIAIQGNTLDMMGQVGLYVDKDSQAWDKYGKPLLLSVFQAGTAYLAGSTSQTFTSGPLGVTQTTVLTPTQQAVQSLNQSLARVGNQLIDEANQLKAKFRIQAGQEFQLVPQADLIFDNDRLIARTAIEMAHEKAFRGAPQSAEPSPYAWTIPPSAAPNGNGQTSTEAGIAEAPRQLSPQQGAGGIPQGAPPIAIPQFNQQFGGQQFGLNPQTFISNPMLVPNVIQR